MSHTTRPGLPAPGQSGIIAGYRLDGYVGQGSKAVVYLAQDERLRRRVALKVLAPELALDAGFRARMIRESRAAAALDHPHIIPVFEAGEAGGTLYVAMRYARGGDARSLLGRLGPLSLGYAGQVIAQIASALDAVHARGLIHRDVRPANILLDGDDAGDHAYLSDFGMSKAFAPGQVIAPDQAAGSLDYLAPEQIEGRALDGRADLYSLACTGFELLCGTPPFGPDQGPTLMYAQIYADPPAVSARRAGIPAAVDSVLAAALAKDPAERYPSCGRFAEELRKALGVRPGEQAGPPRPAQPRGVTERRPAVVEEQPAAGTAPLDLGADGFGPDPSAPRRPALRPVMAAAAVVAVIAAVVSGVALSKRSAPAQPTAASSVGRSPSPSATGATAASSPPGPELAAPQAAALGTLLTSSAAARTALHQAVSQVGACTNLSGAVSQLQDVVNQRSSEYGRASGLATSALPGGTKVKSALVVALGSSLKADQDYLTWARQQLSGGCTPTSQSSSYSAAFSASQQADAAKEAFVQVWNPVAAKYGIAQESPRDI